MNIIKKLKNFENGTSSENDIKNYILEHPDEIGRFSARDLGKVTYTSAASVVRFCNKLGYDGYTDFKLNFVSELKLISQEENSGVDPEIEEKENVVTVMRKVTDMERRAIRETGEALSFEKIKRVKNIIDRCEMLDFYAYDLNVNIAQYASSQFLYAGKKSTVYTATNMRMFNALLSNEKNAAIVISQTGENSRLVELAKILRKNGAKVIVITQNSESSLGKVADEYIYAATTKDIEAFSNQSFFSSVKYILDILWGLEFSLKFERNIDKNKEFDRYGEKYFWGLIQPVKHSK